MFCSGAIDIHAQNPAVEATVARMTWPSPPRSTGASSAAVLVATLCDMAPPFVEFKIDPARMTRHSLRPWIIAAPAALVARRRRDGLNTVKGPADDRDEAKTEALPPCWRIR